MKILYVIDSLRVGGAESVLCNLIRELTCSYDDVRVEVVVLYALGRFGSELQSFGTPVTCLSSPRIPTPKHLYRLAWLINSGSYNIIHTHLFPANYAIALLSLLGLRLPPLIHTEHSVWNRRRTSWVGRFLDGIVYRRFSCIIGVSCEVCEALKKWLPSLQWKMRVIPNGVRIEGQECAHRHNSKPQILFVGSLRSKVKGLDILLEALSLLGDVECSLCVLGDGSLRPEMENLSYALGIDDKVHFLGIRSDVEAFMRRSNCLVLPSRWEGLSMAVLESMAAGCPVVATSVGGIPELIEDQVTGWLIPPEDPESLVRVLRWVLDNPQRRLEVAKAALAKVRDHYSIEKMASRAMACYREVLEEQHGCRST